MTTLSLASHADRGPDRFSFQTAEGPTITGVDGFRDAELALLEAADPGPDTDVVAIDGNYGVPGVVLGALSPSGQTTVSETSARCGELVATNATRNGVDLDVSLVPAVRAVGGRYDLAVYAPRAYDPIDVVAQRAGEALGLLRPGGTLLLAGPAEAGVERVADRLSSIAPVAAERAAGVPVYRLTRPDRVLEPRWERPRWIEATVDERRYRFLTRPGLFSPGRLDPGSRILIETILNSGHLDAGDRVLDLCAGYGAVGVTLADQADISLVLTEDDCRATACAEATLAANGIEADLVTADGLAGVDGAFDLIVTNPPTHAGRSVTEALFAGATDHLTPGGSLAVVANATMNYADRLEAHSESVSVKREAQGYQVVVARQAPSGEDTA